MIKMISKQLSGRKATSVFSIFLALLAVFFLSVIGLTVYGIVLAFQASLVLGVIMLLIHPAPMILGMVALCGYPEVVTQIATWLNLP